MIKKCKGFVNFSIFVGQVKLLKTKKELFDISCCLKNEERIKSEEKIWAVTRACREVFFKKPYSKKLRLRKGC